VDDTGDWSVSDTYQLSDKNQLSALVRVISLRDGDKKEFWLIKNGKATRQPPAGSVPTLDFIPDLPVVTDLKAFPFWPLLRDSQREIRSKGMACTAKGPTPSAINLNLYIFHDRGGGWCAFKGRTEWNSEVESRKPLEEGTLGFVDARLVTIDLTRTEG